MTGFIFQIASKIIGEKTGTQILNEMGATGLDHQVISRPAWRPGYAYGGSGTDIYTLNDTDWDSEISNISNLTRTTKYVNDSGDVLEVSSTQTADENEAIYTRTINLGGPPSLSYLNPGFQIYDFTVFKFSGHLSRFPDIEQGGEYEVPIEITTPIGTYTNTAKVTFVPGHP